MFLTIFEKYCFLYYKKAFCLPQIWCFWVWKCVFFILDYVIDGIFDYFWFDYFLLDYFCKKPDILERSFLSLSQAWFWFWIWNFYFCLGLVKLKNLLFNKIFDLFFENFFYSRKKLFQILSLSQVCYFWFWTGSHSPFTTVLPCLEFTSEMNFLEIFEKSFFYILKFKNVYSFSNWFL